MKKKVMIALIAMMSLFSLPTAFAQEAPAAVEKAVAKVETIVVESAVRTKSVAKYDTKALKASYDKAVSEAEEGKKDEAEASILGTLVNSYSDGTTETVNANFTQSKGGVAVQKVDDLFTINNVFMMICAVLVFIMHLGFATLETGLTRPKNSINILFKNVSIVAIGTLMYALVGFNLMYPGDGNWIDEGVLPKFVVGLTAPEGAGTVAYSLGYTWYTDFLFQAMFAAATASVVSGAVCERIKLGSFLLFCTLFAGIVYPILGAAHWGGGFISAKGFYDLAGSTLVHSVGGWAALAGMIVVGARKGKFGPDGKARAIMGGNIPLAAIGAMLLWFGWFGFNAGSILSADPAATSHVMVTTLLSACAGVVSSMVVSWVITKKPDLTMILNGALAGLVGITAGADVIAPGNAVIVGLVAGALVVVAVLLIDKIKLDDPVGAVSVHLVCGIWGTLAVGLFSADHSFGVQALGVAYYAIAFPVALVLFYIIKVTIGVRVHEEEEVIGLDIGEHSMEAYTGFQIFNNQ